MKLLKLASMAGALALAFSSSAGAASYSASYVADAGNAAAGWVTGTSDGFDQTFNVGDSLTVSFSAPTGLAFLTNGGYLFDYQYQYNGLSGATLHEDVTYAFYKNGSVVSSGSMAGEWACCVDLRLPVYSSPVGAWDKLVYTATLVDATDTVVLRNGFSYSQGGATYTPAVPEASELSMMLAGLGVFGLIARRSRKSA